MGRIVESMKFWAVAAGTVLCVLAMVSGSARADTAIGPKGLEARLLAPCCYGGTLDVHDSELAHDLRKEIEDRMARGESASAIEADFVARFGPRVRALPTEGALTTSFVVAFGAIASAALLLFWRTGARAAKAAMGGSAGSGPTARDALDEELDEELADRDE
jgi:cytochrome c-type biogenesis protein CcmH